MKKLLEVNHMKNSDTGELGYRITLNIFLESDKIDDVTTVLVNLSRFFSVTDSELETFKVVKGRE